MMVLKTAHQLPEALRPVAYLHLSSAYETKCQLAMQTPLQKEDILGWTNSLFLGIAFMDAIVHSK